MQGNGDVHEQPTVAGAAAGLTGPAEDSPTREGRYQILGEITRGGMEVIRCKQDPDLAVVRAPEHLAKLPAEEQARWRGSWAGMDEQLQLLTSGK